MRDGCPPHDDQSAADAAVAETSRDKSMMLDDTIVAGETPATIFLKRVEYCSLVFMDVLVWVCYSWWDLSLHVAEERDAPWYSADSSRPL